MSWTPKVGERVCWVHVSRRGYGFMIPRPARVVRVMQKRARIAVGLRDGGEVERTVLLTSLRTDDGRMAVERLP